MLHLAMHSRQCWQRWRHNIAVDVSASRDGVQRRLIDINNGLLEISFYNSVILNRLTRRKPNRLIRMLRRNAVQAEPL